MGVVAAVALALPSSAGAVELTVTTLEDLDAASCATLCSLRAAIKDSNTTMNIDGSPNVIRLPAGTLLRNPAFAAPRVTSAVVIAGQGARRTTVRGSSAPGFTSRVLLAENATLKVPRAVRAAVKRRGRASLAIRATVDGQAAGSAPVAKLKAAKKRSRRSGG